MSADFIDDRRKVVLLVLGGEPLSLVEHKPRLCSGLALFRLWDRRDELGTTSVLNDLLRGLPCVIKLPMPPWVFVRGVQNRVVKKWIRHFRLLGEDYEGDTVLCITFCTPMPPISSGIPLALPDKYELMLVRLPHLSH